MNYKRILEKIAQNNQATPEDIDTAIHEAIQAAYLQADPEVKQRQQCIAHRGEIPTPEELITQIVEMLLVRYAH